MSEDIVTICRSYFALQKLERSMASRSISPKDAKEAYITLLDALKGADGTTYDNSINTLVDRVTGLITNYKSVFSSTHKSEALPVAVTTVTKFSAPRSFFGRIKSYVLGA